MSHEPFIVNTAHKIRKSKLEKLLSRVNRKLSTRQFYGILQEKKKSNKEEAETNSTNLKSLARIGEEI